jgi:thiamine-monophosphate kinase
MDLSDGLADAVRQIAAASGVGVLIQADCLPISAAARHFHEAHGGSAVETALTGGDDYELVFTCRPAQRGRLRGVRQQLGDLPIRKIGIVTRDRALVVAGDGSRALPGGFEHFR